MCNMMTPVDPYRHFFPEFACSAYVMGHTPACCALDQLNLPPFETNIGEIDKDVSTNVESISESL